MPNIIFPRLRLLIYGPAYSESTTTFLLNHPGLEGLHFLAQEIIPHATCAVDSIKLPNLTSFIGPGRILEVLELGTCLNDALIRWPDEADILDYDAAVKALAPSANHISRLSCSQSFLDIRLLPVIAKHLPALPNLRLHVLMADGRVRVLSLPSSNMYD